MSHSTFETTDGDLDIAAIFEAANRRHQEDELPVDVGLLVDCAVRYNRIFNFQSHDLITWKPNMRYRRFPANNQPCVFVRWLDQPIITEVESNSGAIICLDRVDMEYGILDEDGDFIVYVSNSNRMMPWVPND
jgi:hypothetical protein